MICLCSIAARGEVEADFSDLQFHTLVFTMNGEEVRGISASNIYGGMYAQAEQSLTLQSGRTYRFKLELESPEGARRDITGDADALYQPMGRRIMVDGQTARLAVAKTPPAPANDNPLPENESGLIIQYEKLNGKDPEKLAGSAGSVYVHFVIE